jgi:Raf kinase inhibitor-like YbhB/YbcL family protein
MIKIKSPVFNQEEMIPEKYTCNGEDFNPPLLIENVPEEAKSLVLIVDDPDAPMGTFTHWLVWNIDPKIKEIKENSVPEGAVLGTNDFGKTAYGGPCPPFGTHRYYFKVYALDTVLDLPKGSNRLQLEKAMMGNVLDSGELMGKFSK